PNNYRKDGQDYTMRSRAITDSCLSLNNINYRWSIANDPTARNVAQFGTDTDPSQGVTVASPAGAYQSVCVQGETTSNTGSANVRATVVNAQGVDGPNGNATFRVDYGYCTSDADCFT